MTSRRASGRGVSRIAPRSLSARPRKRIVKPKSKKRKGNNAKCRMDLPESQGPNLVSTVMCGPSTLDISHNSDDGSDSKIWNAALIHPTRFHGEQSPVLCA